MKTTSIFRSLVLLSIFLVPTSGPAAAPERVIVMVDTTASVAAWNVANATDARRAMVAQGIVMLDAELVMITECPNETNFDDLIFLTNDAGGDYVGYWRRQNGGDHIGILAKAGVEVTDLELIEGSDVRSTLRQGLAAEVTIGEFDFLVVGLHLKAGRSGADRALRDQQVEAVAEYIKTKTSAGEKDVLVIGDYNMIPAFGGSTNDNPNFASLNPDGQLRYLSSETLAGGGSHISSSGVMGNLLDGYAIAAQETGEYLEGSLRLFPMHEVFSIPLGDFRDDVADHLPLVADFLVTIDDD